MIIKNIYPTHPDISKQKAWEGFKVIASRKGLYNGLSAAYSVYDFEGNIINSSGVYRFPAEALECM